MLITNFASGELSKTLFGRTDLPQFYCGASKLQNFDVVPTGGLRRRSGLEHLETLDEEGRLIPFIVRRDLHFLLLLTPGKITVYKLVNGEIAVHPDGTPDVDVYASDTIRRAYENLEHIRDVQYAQNYDTMILCHEDYAPLEVLLTDTGRLGIRSMTIDNSVKIQGVNATAEETSAKYSLRTDPEYAEGGYLRGEGNYPRCVTFYNGRVVFAGTRNDPQRVFFSKVVTDEHKEIGAYPFATHDFFPVKVKTYTAVLGTPNPDNTSEITLRDMYERLKFTEAELWEYRMDCPFYDKDVTIKSLSGDDLILSREANGSLIDALSEGEKKKLEEKITKFDDYDKPGSLDSSVYDAGFVTFTRTVTGGSGSHSQAVVVTHERKLRLKIGVTKFAVGVIGTTSFSSYEYDGTKSLLDENESFATFAQLSTELSTEHLQKKLAEKVSDKIRELRSSYAKDSPPWTEVESSVDVEAAAVELKARIKETMEFPFSRTGFSKPYYDDPRSILSELEAKFGKKAMYISFYLENWQDDAANSYATPDCGFTFEVASDANDAIRWLTVNKGLIIGTEMGEFIVPPDVHATNVHAIPNSRYGSDTIQGTAIGDATVFFESGKKSLIEYYIPRDDSHFRKNNMAMLNPEILSESPAREFDFMTSPYTKLLITREDGQLVTLLYERSTGTFAWSRITTGEVSWDAMPATEIQAEYEKWLKEDPAYRKRDINNAFIPPKNIVQEARGKVLSVAVLPGHDGNDDIYLIVRRIVRKNIREPEQGEERYFLERLRESGARAERAVYLDGWREWKWETEAEKEALLALYGGEAVVYDENSNDTFQVAQEPEVWNKYQHQKRDDDYRVIYTDCFGKTRTQNGEVPRSLPPSSDADNRRYIGYLYTSAMRTMPLLDNKKMNDSKFTKMYVRYFDSYMPDATPLSDVRSGESGGGSGPFSGVIARTFSEGPRVDPQYETNHNRPTRYCILSMCAE